MKKFLLIAVLMLALFIIVVYSAYAVDLDAPHNAPGNISCTDCHQQPPGTTPYSDDRCLSCHTNATGGGYTKNSAPRMVSHSSANTTDKYGTWSVECVACHNKHVQDQVIAGGAAAYLVTGTIDSVTDNGDGTTTFSYYNAVETEIGSGWGNSALWGRKSGGNASGGNERGLILYPNTANPLASFEVFSATETSITVRGSINTAFPGTVASGDTFALAYGQNINAGILTGGSTTVNISFRQNSSRNSFAYNSSPGSPDPVVDGICQVCHTRTSFWRADGSLADHFNGANCTTCHRHEAGFKTSCEICHVSPPSTGAHETHFAAGQTVYGAVSIQSTTAAYGYSCGICHQGQHLNTAANPRTAETVFGGIAIQNSASNAAYTAGTFTIDDPGTGYTFNSSDGTCSNTYCHGKYPGSGKNAVPSWDGSAACGSCHGASNTEAPFSGSHALHANANYGASGACTLCHAGIVGGAGPNSYVIADRSRHANGVVDWQFDPGSPLITPSSSYSLPSGTLPPTDGYNRLAGTCSNVYCHSIGQTATGGPLTGAPGEYITTPRWGTPSFGQYFCGACHKNGSHHNYGSPSVIDSGSHPKHLEYNFNIVTNQGTLSYRCAICHRYDPQSFGSYNSCDSCHSNDTLASGHADGKMNVKIDTYFGTVTYNDTSPAPGTPGNGFFSCSNSYCHSSGTSVSTGVIPGNTSAAWGGGVLSCGSCHGNPPSYANGSPKKNSHPAHAAESCNKCHSTTTTNGTTIASTTDHVNKAYNVSPDTGSGVAFTYIFAASGGSCSGISCHGGNAATWGATVGCQDCHIGTADLDDFAGAFSYNGIASKIKGAGEWDATGHGRSAGSGNYSSGNAAADFTAAHACLYCHDGAVTHKVPANPFRLRNIDDAAWGKNGVCQSCHAADSAGITVDSALRNGAKKVGSLHYGAKHGVAGNGGQFCWDCHDPHGDANIFMVQAEVAKISDVNNGAPVSSIATSFLSYSTGTGYAASSSPYSGICNVCHTSTEHYTGTSGDGHNEASRCTSCHAHTRDSQTNAFQAACDACHGNPPIDDNTLAGFVLPSRTGSTTAGAHSKHVDTLRIGCESCHAGSMGSGSSHANGDLTVSLGFSLFDGVYSGGSYSGQETVSYNASSPSTTVSSNGLKECSNIYCHGSTMAPNAGSDTSPVWDNPASVSCGSCHGASSANAPRKGAHFRHTGPYSDVGHEYPCSSCHTDPATDASLHVNNQSEVSFSTHPTVSGGSYSGTTAMMDAYGTCSSVYCHSTVQTSPPGGAPTYKTINWGTSYGGDMGCSACHEGPLEHYSEPIDGNTSGSHLKHSASGIYCATCHANDVTQDPDPGTFGWACYTCHSWNGPNVTHANYAVDVNIVNKFGGAYSGTPAPGDAYGSCSSTYCHSSGVSVRTGTISSGTSVNWGSGSQACNACHGNALYPEPNNAMPDYANGNPKENSHQAHVIGNGISCQNCHYSTTTTGISIANTDLHINKAYDMQANGTFGGSAISFVYTGPTASEAGSCSSISCHGGNAASWGGSLSCQDCHAGGSDAENFSGAFWDNGTAGVVSSAEWRATGHGRPASSGAYASGNQAADFVTNATNTALPDNGCRFCHDGSTGHKSAANPFRLRNLADPVWGKNGACQLCHAEGSAGVTVDTVQRNGSKKIGSTHYGSGHNVTASGGQFCWDCHDPHGDNNAFMVHDAVAAASDAATAAPTATTATAFTAFATGSDFAKSSAPFNGICNVCHTLGDGSGMVSHYSSTSGDGHNESTACTVCHSHEGSTPLDAFQPGGDNCSDCHSSAGGPTPGSTTADAYHAKHGTIAFEGKVSLGSYGSGSWYYYGNTGGAPGMGCGYCHPQSDPTHMNGTIDLNFNPGDAGAAGTLKAKNNPVQTYTQTSRVNVSCSSVYCHSDGYLSGSLYGYRTTPNWYGGTYAPGDKCAGCHSNSPTGSTAHAKHVVSNHYRNIYTGTVGLAAAGNTDAGSHGNPGTSTTINCNICHNSTVTAPVNDANTVCATCHAGQYAKGALTIAPSATTHVNGAIDVVFAPIQVRTKAQIRDDIASVTELNSSWTRTNGYKAAGSFDSAKSALAPAMFMSETRTCSNIACHNGNPVSWNSTVTCDSCHTALP